MPGCALILSKTPRVPPAPSDSPREPNGVDVCFSYHCILKVGFQIHIPISCKDPILGIASGSLLYLGFGETQRPSSENAAWVGGGKSLVLASEVQGMAPPPTSWVISGQLSRLDASSVKWGDKYLVYRVGRPSGASLSRVRVLSKLAKANRYVSSCCPVLSPASVAPFSELPAFRLGFFLAC